MAGEIIRPSALPDRPAPVAAEKVPVDNGATVGGSTIEALVNAGRPLANQTEAEAGTQPTKAMTPLTVAQAIAARVPGIVNPIIAGLNLGTASTADIGDFATAAQGDKADTAVQPEDIGTMAYEDADDYAVAARGLPSGGAINQLLVKVSGTDFDAEWRTSAAATSVSYEPQSLTLEQQEQARDNIGSADATVEGPWVGALPLPSVIKIYQRMDLRDFGVEPDSGNDEFSAIQRAFNATFNEKEPLYITPGTYFHDAPLHISEESKLRGSGSFSALFVKTSRTTRSDLPALLAPGGAGGAGIYENYNGIDASLLVRPLADGGYAANIDIEGLRFTSGGSGRSAYGIYAPAVSLSRLRDVTTSGQSVGYHSRDTWMTSYDGLRCHSHEIGISFDRNSYVGETDPHNGGTSLSFRSCWAHECTDAGWLLRGLNYSNLSACGADGIGNAASPNPQRAYWVQDSRGMVMDGCGAEIIRGTAIFALDASISINRMVPIGLYGDNSLAGFAALIEASGSSDVTIDGLDATVWDDTKLWPFAVYDSAVVRHRGVKGLTTSSVFAEGGEGGNGKLIDMDRNCNASVTFTVSGGVVSVVDSYRIVSVVRNGTGDFSVTFREGVKPSIPVAMTSAASVTHYAIDPDEHRFVCIDASGNPIDPTVVTWSA